MSINKDPSRGLIKRIPKASEAVAREYEKEIETLANKEQTLKEGMANPKMRGVNFETALVTVVDYIENPSKKWETGSFTDKLLYDREKGFGTAQLSLPMKAFEQFSTSNSQGVEMAGSNPRPKFFQNDIY